jgi:hypothetical protein
MTQETREPSRLSCLLLLGATVAVMGCGSRAPLRASLRSARYAKPVTKNKVLTRSHFTRDRSGALSEADLQRILAAPVFLESKARVGVLPVATAYAPDRSVPVETVAGALSRAMEDTGHFDVSTEVAADWPADRGTAGLRELAARYRAEYLLLYRHRFVHRSHTNGWGWGYLTVLGALIVPATTLEVAGVLEATLFEVKSGTLLFTVQKRVYSKTDENVWNREPKKRAIRAQLLTRATRQLAGKVVGKIRRLVAARDRYDRKQARQKKARADAALRMTKKRAALAAGQRSTPAQK